MESFTIATLPAELVCVCVTFRLTFQNVSQSDGYSIVNKAVGKQIEIKYFENSTNDSRMETTDQFHPMQLSTIVVIKNRCQFCYAFFKDPLKIVEHSRRCEFRFSEMFKAFDGLVKFACAVNMTTIGIAEIIISSNFDFARRFVSTFSIHELTTKCMSECISFQVNFHVHIATNYFWTNLNACNTWRLFMRWLELKSQLFYGWKRFGGVSGTYKWADRWSFNFPMRGLWRFLRTKKLFKVCRSVQLPKANLLTTKWISIDYTRRPIVADIEIGIVRCAVPIYWRKMHS